MLGSFVRQVVSWFSQTPKVAKVNIIFADDHIFNPMQDGEFWHLINLIECSGCQAKITELGPLEEALEELSAEAIGSFFETLARKLYLLDTRAHFEAYDKDSFSSDVFLYTRLAVVAQGWLHYEEVVKNPSKFPRISTNWLEELLYVAPNAFEKITGTELSRLTSVNFESFSNEEGWKK